MQTVRRLYLYVMSGITFAVLSVGVYQLLVVVFGELGVDRGYAVGGQGYREQLSLAIALVGVGLPVWAIHWWLAQRGLQAGRAHADDEHASAVRALYLTVVLFVLLSLGAASGLQLLHNVIQGLLGGPSDLYGSDDAASGLAGLIVTGLGWGYHVTVRRRDMRAVAHTGAAAWLPRVYLYGAALVGLLVAQQSIGDLVGWLIRETAPGGDPFDDGQYRTFQIASLGSTAIVWGVVWIGHWWYATRLIRQPGWRGESERPARLRLAFFVAVIIASAASVIRLVGEALRAILVPALGATEAIGAPVDSGDLLAAVLVAMIAAVPWAIAWWTHVRLMHRESAQLDIPGRVALAVRLDLYGVALVGLAFGATGVAWLLGMLLDILLGGDRTGDANGYWRIELATFIPYAVLGLVAWTWKWWQARAQQAADPTGEAASTVRRSYLMIVLAASIVVGLGSLAVVLYRLFGSVLGANLGGNPASELSTPLGLLIVAVAVALYHGLALRRDLDLREAAGPVPAEAAAARRSLVLSGPPGSDLDGTVKTLREGLPEGYRLDDG